MALGGTSSFNNDDNDDVTETLAATDSAAHDSSEFLYLRDLLSALDMTSLSLNLVVRLLEANELSEDIKKALSFVQETDQIRVHAHDILEKLEKVSAAVEGTLQAVSALEVSRRTRELLKSTR